MHPNFSSSRKVANLIPQIVENFKNSDNIKGKSTNIGPIRFYYALHVITQDK